MAPTLTSITMTIIKYIEMIIMVSHMGHNCIFSFRIIVLKYTIGDRYNHQISNLLIQSRG